MPNTSRVRVFIAEDHPIFLEGITSAIEQRPEFELVGSATGGRESLDRIRELEPDVAIIDLGLPQLNGIEILDAILREEIGTRVIILSASSDSRLVFDAVRLGARGYLTKDSPRSEICDAVALVERGGTVLAPEVQAGLATEIQLRDSADGLALSPRESEILRLAADGLSGPQIAARLDLSPSTIKTHLHHLYRKLGVTDRAAAVAEAMRRGLFE